MAVDGTGVKKIFVSGCAIVGSLVWGASGVFFCVSSWTTAFGGVFGAWPPAVSPSIAAGGVSFFSGAVAGAGLFSVVEVLADARVLARLLERLDFLRLAIGDDRFCFDDVDFTAGDDAVAESIHTNLLASEFFAEVSP